MKPDELFNIIKSEKYKTVGDDVDYYVKVDDQSKTIWLLFQESRSRRDWDNNLGFLLTVFAVKWWVFVGCRGWISAWRTAKERIIGDVLEELKEHDDYKLKIGGWSYGGTIAVWAIPSIWSKTHRKIDTLATFGAAKPLFGIIGKIVMRIFMVKKVRQYAHWHDFVPMCPFVPLYTRLGTKHVGKHWWKFWELFNTAKWHCSYGDPSYYDESEDL